MFHKDPYWPSDKRERIAILRQVQEKVSCSVTGISGAVTGNLADIDI